MHILDDLVVERATVTLRHRGATAFHFYHGGRLMGLLMRAWDPSPAHRLPVGLVPVPVERGVVEYSAGEAYRFGVVHVGREPFDWERLWHGMQRVGMAADHGGSTPWHFSVGDTAVERLPRATELAASLGGQQGALLLRLLTPLRLMRPNAEQRPGHGYLDGDWFCARTFLRRVASRQLRLLLGVQPSEGDLAQLPPPLEGAAATPGRLWWLDLTRGAERKPTGGVVGRVLLDGIDEHWLPWLALLPWSHVGEGTHFGYGRVEVSRNGVTPGPSAAWPPPCTTLLDRALEPQALREAAQVLAGVHTEGAGHGASSGNPLLRAQRLGALARSGRLRAWPLTGVILPKPEGGVRAIAFPAMAERILQRAAGRVLARGIDELHEDASFGYRQRLSHGSAARAVARAGRDGLRHVVDADVSAFFDSVDLSHLEAKLEAFLPQEPLVPLLMAWLRAPVHFDGEIIRRERGLPQGLPISPVLANFLLDELDEAVQGAGFRLVRYADDFVICCRTEDEARRAHALVADVLARMGLVLHPTKTRVTTFAEGFRFVGHLFRHDQVTEVAPSSAPTPSADGPRAEWTPPEHSWLARVPASRLRELVERRRGRWEARVGTGAAREDSPVDADRVVALAALDTPRAGTGRPLWVLEQGVRVRRGGERLLVEREESLQEYPMRALSHVVIGSGVRITVPALLRLADLQVPVFVLRRDGGLRARVGTAMADWPLWEAQARVARDPGARLAAARAIVAAKVANQREVVRRHAGAMGVETIVQLTADERSALGAVELAQLRGIEGSAARRYFAAFRRGIGEGWGFSGRRRRPPPDPANALLSFGYAVLHALVETAVQVAGLHPRIGCLHDMRRAHAALASDLVEEWRWVVDDLVWPALRDAEWRTEDFERTPECDRSVASSPGAAGEALPGCWLTPGARRRFVARVLQRVAGEPVQHEGREVTLHVVLDRQAVRYRDWVRADRGSYQPFRLGPATGQEE